MISYLYVRLSALPRGILIPLILLAAALATIAIPTAAQAAMVLADDPVKGGWKEVGDGSGFQDSYLPVARWSDAASMMHTRTSGSDFNVTMNSMTKGQIASNLMLFGNFCYTMMVKIVEMSIYFDALETAGKQVDEAFATVGTAIANSPIFTFVIVIAIVAALLIGARRRSGKPIARMLFKPVLLAAVFALLVGGASASTDDKPGKMGPWWTATTINNLVTALATGPATALQETDLGFGKEYSDKFADDPMSCKLYMDTMAENYVTEGDSKAASMSRSMALSLSNMWEATAVEAYSQAQFGGSDYSDKTFCRLLDLNTPSPDVLKTSQEITKSVTGETQEGSASIQGYDTVTDDISTLYWAACTWDGKKFGVDEDWAKVRGGKVGEVLGDGKEGASCSKWWDEKPASAVEGGKFKTGEDSDSDPLNIGASDTKDFNKKTEGASGDIKNFISTFQGWSGNSAAVPAATYAVSSALISAAFGLLGLLIFGAKIGMIAMLLLLGVAIIMDMFPVAESKLKKYGMSYMGMALLAFGVQFVFSILVMLSSIIANAGSEFVGSNTIARSIWLGLAPIIAFVLLHMFITKWLKAPSPFTPSGAMAVMKGAAGGQLLSAGMSSLNRHRRGADRGGDGDGDIGAGAAAANAGGVGGAQRDEQGNISSGTTDKMGGRGGKPDSGTEDGADPQIGAGAGAASDAPGASAGAVEGAGDDGEDGEANIDAGAPGSGEGHAVEGSGEGGEVHGELGTSGAGAEADSDGHGQVEAHGSGQGGGSGLGAAGAAGALGSSGDRSYDDIRDEKKKKRQGDLRSREQMLNGRQAGNTARHQMMERGAPAADASLGTKARYKMAKFGSKASTVGKNTALGARKKAVQSGGYRAVAGKAAGGVGRMGMSAGKWATKGGGVMAGARIAHGAATGAVGAGLIAGGVATAFVAPGVGGAMASFGANRVRAGKNLTAAGLRSDAVRGTAGRASKATWRTTKKAGATAGGYSGRVISDRYKKVYANIHNKKNRNE